MLDKDAPEKPPAQQLAVSGRLLESSRHYLSPDSKPRGVNDDDGGGGDDDYDALTANARPLARVPRLMRGTTVSRGGFGGLGEGGAWVRVFTFAHQVRPKIPPGHAVRGWPGGGAGYSFKKLGRALEGSLDLDLNASGLPSRRIMFAQCLL